MVSIQGTNASLLAIPQNRIRAFESAVNAILGTDALFIFSGYRSDIIYQGSEDHNLKIIALWQLYANVTDGSSFRRSFFQTTTKKDTLEAFFVRLIYLSANKQWFNPYVESLRRTISGRSGHRLAKALIKCQKYIKNEGIHKIFDLEDTTPKYADPVPHIPGALTRNYLEEYPVN
ncbi:hypothetical protein [Fulvivirga sedimenti]|uniref:Uncharacterized protein n=1 Tax=Fulvivirga sedimenti TaxID=2879465 RepID=A0A9X1HSP2_9BACT|nr:hypothetical protein [Fulvivirga sedimenti]MCA6074900.1 hypothetical protein [Fulvivirga sedimenti]MCA6076077.1 hypothetical protein [Fulvivirga sedimenti]MCA6077205.1 hypothetical protein [Fulvivirga sedimenti]